MIAIQATPEVALRTLRCEGATSMTTILRLGKWLTMPSAARVSRREPTTGDQVIDSVDRVARLRGAWSRRPRGRCLSDRHIKMCIVSAVWRSSRFKPRKVAGNTVSRQVTSSSPLPTRYFPWVDRPPKTATSRW